MAAKKSELKVWFKERLKGLENCLVPSFTPDFSDLDEEGIIWDVRQSIRHGFVSTLCTAECGLSFEEAKRFVEIVADEAKGKIFVSVTVMFDTFKQNFEMLRHAQKVGCDSALLGYPPNFYPKSEEEIYSITKEMCDAAPNLGIVVYPCMKYNFHRFHPSGFPPGLLSRICDIENTVAMKVGMASPGYPCEAFRLCGNKVLVNVPMEAMTPLLIPAYGQQWMGAIPYEAFQSPEKPYLVDYFNLMLKGEVDKAMEIYWKLEPIRAIFMNTMMSYQAGGTYHWPMWKYYQWCVGGNGGMTRQPVMKMAQHDMEAHKSALRAIGITPREPGEEFFVGRVNYARAKRSK